MNDNDDRPEEVRDRELRDLAYALVRDLREALQSTAAEARDTSRTMMEALAAASDGHRHERARQVWLRLLADPSVFLQGDYGLLRTGLRRTLPGGAWVDLALTVHVGAENIVVSGSGLQSALGLALRLNGETVVIDLRTWPHRGRDRSVVVPLGDVEPDDASDELARVTQRVRDPRKEDGLLTVVAFGSSAVTGFGFTTLAAFSDLSDSLT